MKANLLDEIAHQSLATLAEPRKPELTAKQPQIMPQPQRQARPAPADPLPPSMSSNQTLDDAALYGVAGLAVCGLAPHSEAHPAAILLQLLAAFGNAVGPAPHCMVDATRHPLNLFVVLVGESSKARKGTSWNQIARLFAEVDHPWLSARVTGERLTAASLNQTLRDQQPSTDRRLLLLCEEFAPVLRALKGSSGHLSPLLRRAWDSGHLPATHLHEPVKPTGIHISLIAHITQRELTSHLHPAEAHNGFANRCLWTSVERSNCLPDGGNLAAEDLAPIARELRAALEWVNSTPDPLFRRDPAAGKLWRECYPSLSQLHPGLRGAATSRAEAQVLRLSAIYAALDSTPVIGLPHLEAALAVWHYCYDSASLLFGMSTGDPVADRIRQAVEASGSGLSKSQILRLFHGHVEGARIDVALETLAAFSLVGTRSEPTGGRPSTRWATSMSAARDEENNGPDPW